MGCQVAAFETTMDEAVDLVWRGQIEIAQRNRLSVM